jgi:hypothetical protein
MSRPSAPPDEPLFPQGSKPQFASAEKSKPLLDARKVDSFSASRRDGEVTYTVTDILTKPKGQDRRGPARKRTRLRCGKVFDQSGTFLIECRVHDRSPRGAQLRLMRLVALPRRIKFFDDEQGALRDAEVIWRKNGEIGIQFLTKLNGQAIKKEHSALGGKYYAVS